MVSVRERKVAEVEIETAENGADGRVQGSAGGDGGEVGGRGDRAVCCDI